MTHRLKKISLFIGLSSATLGIASAACIDHVAAQDDGTITRAGLVAYNDCIKAEMDIPRPPIKFSTTTWANACSTVTTPTGCVGDTPSTNANTKLVLQVTNIFGLANLPSPNTSPASYSSGTIWIGTYPAGSPHNPTKTSASTSLPAATWGICAAYDETGWPVPLEGMTTGQNAVPIGAISSGGAYYLGANSGAVPQITMLDAKNVLGIPLYIICIGFQPGAASPTPAAPTPSTLGTGFDIAWAA